MIFFNIQILIKVKRNVSGERFVSQYKMWSAQFSGIKIRFFQSQQRETANLELSNFLSVLLLASILC